MFLNQYFTNNDQLKSERRVITYYYGSTCYEFLSDNGVFSKSKIDFGSITLIETYLKNRKDIQSFLDVGCGYGFLSIVLSKELNVCGMGVDVNLRALELAEENAKLNYDVCRTIGIILDNAIEETIKLNKKEREILISMYVEEDFVIEISNHFIGDVDVDKIFNKGYTTKTEGHGYGLTLLRKIIDNNNRITNQVKIIDNLFTQIIKIKM